MGRKLKCLVITVFTCLFPIILTTGITLVLLFLPVWSLVHTFAKVFRPELKRGVNPFEAFLAQEKDLERDLFNVWTYFVIDGHIPTATIRQMAQANVFSLKETNGQLVFSKLKETMTHFLGYSFWKSEDSFNVHNHIRDYDYEGKLALPNPCYEKDLKETMGTLLVLPWKKNMPHWEILVHHNYLANSHSKPRTVLIGRIHHSVMDGYSFLHLLETMFRETFAFPSQARKYVRESKIKQMFNQLLSIIKIPSDFAGTVYDGFDTSEVFLVKKYSGREYNSCVTTPIKDLTLRKIRKKYNVAYGSAVATIFSGALKRVFDYAGQPYPDSISIYMPFPAPGHPKVVANHMDFRPLRLPLKSKSRTDRLLETDKNFVKSKSRCVLSPFMIVPLQFVPTFLAHIIFNRVMVGRSSFLLSVFLAQPPFSLSGRDVIDSAAGFTGVRNRAGGSCLCYGTPNRLRLCLMLNTEVVRSKEAVLMFSDFVQEEAEALLGDDSSPVEQK